MKPIDLSDEQPRIVGEYVSNIPVRWRSRYISGVHTLLACEPTISNRAVVEACADVARATMLGAGAAPVLGDDD